MGLGPAAHTSPLTPSRGYTSLPRFFPPDRTRLPLTVAESAREHVPEDRLGAALAIYLSAGRLATRLAGKQVSDI